MQKAQVSVEYIIAFFILATILVILTYLFIWNDYSQRILLSFMQNQIFCNNYSSILSMLYISSKNITWDFNADKNFFLLKDETILLGDFNLTTENLADENFESGSTNGGSGWLNDWQLSGNATITTYGSPHNGSYHLRLRRIASAERNLSLKNATSAKLTFWRKLRSLETTDRAFVKISCNKTNWLTIFTYADGDDDNLYHKEEYDLNAFLGCENFYVAFVASMSANADYFYVDDINITFQKPVLSQKAAQCKFYANLEKSASVYSGITNHFKAKNNSVASYKLLTKTLSFEDFESSKLNDANGFNDDWILQGGSKIVRFSNPHSGSYHLRLRRIASAERNLSLKNATSAKLTFWRKLRSLETTDRAFVKISCNKTNWLTIFTYADGDDDNIYHKEEYDLNAFLGCENFYIKFIISANSNGDYFYVDDINVSGVVKENA